MFIRIATWTIYIFLIIIPTFSSGGALKEGTPDVKEPKTMYDVVAEKCHNLEVTGLKENEIFTKKCVSWAEINATKSFDWPTKDNVQCLVFYDALVSFCTSMGDSLGKVQGLIPTTSQLEKLNYSSTTICSEGRYNLYPINKTEHNLASLVKNTNDCLILCLDFSGVSDICKYAYYFTTFDISKFIENLNGQAAHKSLVGPTQDLGKSNLSIPTDTNKTQPKEGQAVINGVPVDTSNKTAVLAPAPKPEYTKNYNSEQQVPLANSVNMPGSKLDQLQPKVPKPEKSEPESETEAKLQKPPVKQEPDKQQVPQSNNPPVVPLPPGNNDIVPPKAVGVNQPAKPNDPEKSLPAPAAPVTDKKVENQDTVQGPPVDYPIGGNSAGADADGADQEVEEDNDLEVDDGDTKDAHGMPVENNDLKTPPKKGKPSIVEDEAVSSFNTPEDDMNGDSYFFSYFTVFMCLVIVGYVGYHNRQKLLALVLEGKKGRRSGRGRRPNSANYHKLDTNLEEAISSSCTKTASNVIY